MATSSKTRILVIDPANFIGGAELFMLDFLHFLAPKNDYSITVATSGLKAYMQKLPSKILVKKVFLPRLKITSLRSWLDFKKSVKGIQALIKKTKADLVIGNSVRANILAAEAVKKTKTPLLWMLHDFTFPKPLLKSLGKQPTKIICVSRSVKKYFLSATKNKFEEKTSVVPNGVDLESISQKALGEVQLPLKSGEHWIGTIGRIEPWKGQMYFVDAAEKVLRVLPRARFFILGAPVEHDEKSVAYFEKLKKHIAEKRLSQKIILTGYLENIYPLVEKLDVVVHTAIEPEPFGRVVIESMAMKKAVIASPLGGPGEIITDGVDGYLVDPKDTPRLATTIIELCQNQTKREAVGQAALEKVKQLYTQEKVFGEMVRNIEEVTKKA